MAENTIGSEPTSPATDRAVSRWVLGQYRGGRGPDLHLVECPDVTVGYSGYGGGYGCDTGCEYIRLEARISCPHGHSDEFEYGDFGEISYLIEDIENDYGRMTER
jgi:hypothetical protein